MEVYAGLFPRSERKGASWMKVEAALLRLGCLEFGKNDPLNEEALLLLDEIHPIFALSNWLPVPTPELRHQGYMNMRPALALATKLITSEMTMGWWIHALYGKLSRHEKSGRWYLAEDPRELDLKQAKREVEAKFSEIARLVRFYWMPRIDGKDFPAGMASYSPYDVMGYLDEERFPLGTVKDGRFLPTIGVDVLFLHHLTHSNGTPHLSQGSNLRLQFYIAIVLVHELAHVFWMMITHRHCHEPYFYLKDDMPEAGYSLEEYIFGCHVASYPFDRTWIGPVYSTSFDQMAAFPCIYIPQPMVWVRLWFFKETWKNPNRTKLQPIVPDTLPDRYEGLFFVDRYVREENIWARVLYKDKAPYALQLTKALVPWSELPFVCVRLGKVPPKQSIAKWFDITKERDVRRAKEQGWSDENFHSGRSNVYEAFCYDKKGTRLADDAA